MADMEIIRGDDEQLELTFSDTSVTPAVPLDLRWCVVFFTVKSVDDFADNDTWAIIAKRLDTFDWDEDDPENWVINMLLTHIETNIEPWDYYRDLQVKWNTGLISSVQRWKFVVEDDTTRNVA